MVKMDEVETVEMFGKMRIALAIITECSEFAGIIPEVRTNLVYSKKNPNDKMDVLAVDRSDTRHPIGLQQSILPDLENVLPSSFVEGPTQEVPRPYLTAIRTVRSVRRR
jgi:hypothetical protein